MTDRDTKLARWRARIQEAEDLCFWPGPRPMSSARWANQLIGRDDESYRFSELVRDTSLVVLNGESGVGKSSMLNLGITPRLEEDGFLVLTCRRWAASRAQGELPSGLERVEEFIAEMLAGQLPEGIDPRAGFIAQLDEEYGDGVVIILDQFEGLIRHQPRFYNEVRRWIEDVVKRRRVHIVISLRTEFMHRISDLRVGPYKRTDFKLDRISDPDVIGQIVRAGMRPDGAKNEVIAEDAADLIVELWKKAEGGLAWTSVGLLHVQALLYYLWRTMPNGEATITRQSVASASEELRAPGNAPALFANALARAVGLRLNRCRDIYVNELKGDRTLAEGVGSLLTRIPDHLESGGYKVSQESRQLAAKVLRRELETLRVRGLDRGMAGELFSTFAAAVDTTDWLAAARADLTADEALRASLTDQVSDAEDEEVTSGPMLGMAPLAVLAEELRRYFFALAWLEQSDIVVPADADGGETMLELVHDGFSRGLKEWAAQNADGPERVLHRLTASIGEVFDWRALQHDEDDSPPGTISTNANLRWRSCRVVGATFRRRAFVNCDFRETSFVGCTFEGVTFINCLLDGVSFIECAIQGDTTALSEAVNPNESDRELERKQLLPSFLVEAPELAATLNRYRDRPVAGATELVSWTSGGPARPISPYLAKLAHWAKKRASLPGDSPPGLAKFRFLDWAAQETGLAMYGGRLSSLMFGDCVISGKVSLRHVAGTSLEFGGQRSGAIELYDVAIRGFSISPPVQKGEEYDGALGTGEPVEVSGTDADLSMGRRRHRPRRPRIEVAVVDSALQNVWFSTPLRGKATITNSVVWHLFNASRADSQGFIVELNDSVHMGLFNVPEVDDFLTAKEANYVPGGEYYDSVEKLAQRVDYQSLANLRRELPVPPEE